MSAARLDTLRRLTERGVEFLLFTSRWLLAPIYLGLALGLAVLLIKFGQHAVALLGHALTSDGEETIIGVLALIDLALMGSLVVMVMFAGYENFVSKLDLASHRDKPGWMGHVDFSDLKLKLMASIVAISAIQVLESFMNVAQLSDRELAWSVGIHATFVISGVLLAVMDRLGGKSHAPAQTSPASISTMMPGEATLRIPAAQRRRFAAIPHLSRPLAGEPNG
ncbi:MAG TPA: TIGR00645 family protein [Acetobacteraceae bacterium]|nr:TIGR00645 family protein [Acetobacteraceae bacterium]